MEDNNIQHPARVNSQGTLIFKNAELFDKDVAQYAGKEVVITVEEKNGKPSDDQYGYYHAGILATALKTELFGGWTKDDLDEFLSNKFLGDRKIRTINGVQVEIKHTPSKATISKRRMSLFIENVLSFMSEHGIKIPEPQYVSTKRYAETGKFKPKNHEIRE